MKRVLMLYSSIVLSGFIIMITWFGFGAWLRNQPSSFLYVLGTSLDLVVPLVLILIVFKVKNVLKKGEQ